MKAPFGPGDVVVAIEDAGTGESDRKIKKGTILSVRKIIPPKNPIGYSKTIEWGLLFWGHKNNCWYDGTEVSYVARKFRLYEPPKPEVKTTDRVKEKTK